MIAFACPHCGQKNSVGDEWAGQRGACPGCNQVVDIPAAPAPSATPIVFACEHCRHKLSVPGAWAGKKGQCPACNQIVPIPASSTTDTFTSLAQRQPTVPAPSAPPPAPAPAQAPADIVFKCAHCNNTLSVPSEWAGKKGQCPNCQQAVRIPAASAPAQTESEIIFACEHCDRKVCVGSAWAGKQGQCPHCQGTILIPLTSTRTYGLVEDDPEDERRRQPKYAPYEEDRRRKKPLYGQDADPPRYRDRTDGGSGDGNNSVIGWIAFVLIFVVGNIILYSTTGWIIIPRR